MWGGTREVSRWYEDVASFILFAYVSLQIFLLPSCSNVTHLVSLEALDSGQIQILIQEIYDSVGQVPIGLQERHCCHT